MFEKAHCVQDDGAEINPVRVIITYSILNIRLLNVLVIKNNQQPHA